MQRPKVPSSLTPVMDSEDANHFTTPWFRFLASLADLPKAIEPVDASVSPYTYVAQASGNLHLNGGTVSSVTLTRADTTITLAHGSGFIPLEPKDSVTITHTGATTAHWVPS